MCWVHVAVKNYTVMVFDPLHDGDYRLCLALWSMGSENLIYIYFFAFKIKKQQYQKKKKKEKRSRKK